MGGREQKEKSGLPRPSYLGSLNGFQIKAKGLPWTHSRRGCFPGNLLAPATGGKASPRSRAWQPPQLPQLVAWFTFPAQANPGSPSQRNRGTIHLQGPPPKRRQGPDLGSSKQGMNRTAVNQRASPCLLWGFGAWGLVSRQAAAPRAPPAYVRLSLFPHWPVHSSKSKASLCRDKYQLSSAFLPSI